MTEIIRTYTINGQDYRKSGWFGCQLKSIEGSKLRLGDMRCILGEPMYVFSIRPFRLRYRWEVSWSMIGIDGAAVDAKERIRAFYRKLETA